MRIARRGQFSAGRGWRPGTSREPPTAITELSRALAAGRPGGLQLFEKLTGNEQLWWRCCRDAVQSQPLWSQYPDRDRALALIRDTELVASRGAVSRAVEAVDFICQALALAADAASPTAQLRELVARAAASWDDSPAVLMAGATGFTPQAAALSAVPDLRDQVTKVLECLEKVSSDRGQALAAICTLLLAADQPDTGRVVRVPVVLARTSEKQASSGGVTGTLELREFSPGPSGLFPDPRGMRNRRADSAFDAGLQLAWQFAAGAARGGRCVLWRLSLDAGVPDHTIDGGSLGAAFAIALRELLRRPRGSGLAPLAARRAFFIGLRPKYAITGTLAAQRPSAYDQLTSRTAKGPWLEAVGGMDAKLEAASAKGLRLVAPAANRAAAQPRAAVPVDWAETIHQADRFARRVRPVRTAVASAGFVLAALAVGLAVITTMAIGQRSTIASERSVAASNAFVDQSEATGASDPVLARLEAVAAWRLNPSPQADDAMLSAAAIPWTAALTSHTANLEDSAAFSPDGTLLAAGTKEGTQLWNVTTRKLVTTLPAGSGLTVDSVTFSPDGTVLAAGTADGTQLWNVTTRKLLTTLSAGNADIVFTVAFSPGGTLLAAGMTDPESETQLWDITTGRLVTTLPAGTGNTVFAVAFSPHGRLLATGAENPDNTTPSAGGVNGTQLWDVATGKLAATLPSGTSDALAFSRDGTLLAAGTSNETQLWNVTMRKLITTLPGSTDHPVNSVAFSRDGTLLAANIVDRTQIWDLATSKLVTTLPPSTGNSVNSVAFSPDDTLLAVGTNNGTWLANLAESVMPSSPGTLPDSTVSNPDAVAFSPDSSLLAADTSDGTIHLWDLATRKLAATLPASTGNSPGGGNSLAFSPNGALLAAITYQQPDYWGIQLWDVATRKLVTTLRPTDFNAVGAVTISPDGSLLAAGVTDGTELWDLATHKLIATLPTTDIGKAIDAVAFSRDGSLLAAGTIGPTQLWDLATRKLIATLPTGTIWTDFVAFSPDSSQLAVGTNNGTQLWDVAARNLVTTLSTGVNFAADSVAFSPDGTVLAITNAFSVELWDAKTLRQITSLNTGNAEFTAFNPNGTLLAVSAEGKPIQLVAPYPRNTASYLCKLAGEPFPPDDWEKYAPGVPYMKTCP